MIQFFNLAFVALTLFSVNASPILDKRIQQDIVKSVTAWEDACNSASNFSQTEQCNNIAINASTSLLLAASNCEQQDAADSFIQFSKDNLGSDKNTIRLAQLFAQQPRNSPNSVAIPYCDRAPVHPELNGLYPCQYQSANQTLFADLNSPGHENTIPLGAPGTFPFGFKQALSPLGSCLANPQGTIADDLSLSDLTQNPFAHPDSGTTAPSGPGFTGSTSPIISPTSAASPTTACTSS